MIEVTILEKFKIKITLLASLIVTSYAFFNNVSFMRTCQASIATIIIFYILGDIIEDYVERERKLFDEKIAEEVRQAELLNADDDGNLGGEAQDLDMNGVDVNNLTQNEAN